MRLHGSNRDETPVERLLRLMRDATTNPHTRVAAATLLAAVIHATQNR